MQELPSAVQPGARVDARGEPWDLVAVDRFDRVSLVTLRGVGANVGASLRLLAPFDRISIRPRQGRLRIRPRHTVLRAALAAIDEAAPWTRCWTATAAAIDVRAWQLEPAHAALAGTTRLLLADEVGLGKTIQALLVAAELSARGLVRRSLILTPAPLREQWAAECGRFALDASVFDHATLAALMPALPVGVNPWDTAPLIIASIDLAKRAEVRQALDATSFDLLVIDEAHHLTPGSDRAALAADLAARTPFLVLVTATPHSGDAEAYRGLCRLGEIGGGEPIAVFRRRARDVYRPRPPRVRTICVPPSDAERALLDEAKAYASRVWRDAGAGGRLAATVIARRACSSARAAAATIARRRALLAGAAEPDQQPLLPWEDECADAPAVDEVLACPGLADRAGEIGQLERLGALALAAAAAPSKLATLRRLIARTRESALVYSEYRDVVDWCASALADLASIAVLHGGLPAAARRDAVARFIDGRARVLVATDAAGEGLNLHARCRLVVNLELPWNPLRLDQRTGRVDRIGQRRRVHVRHLVHDGSFEDLVLARLEARRRTAAAEFESAGIADDAVAACVLGGAALPDPARAAAPAPPPGDEPSAAAVVHARLVRTASMPARPDRPLVAIRPRRGLGDTLVLLYAFDLLDGTGRGVQRETIAVRVAIAPSCRRLSAAMVLAADRSAEMRAALDTEVAPRLDAARRTLAGVAVRLDARLSGLATNIDARRGETPVQGSLFDRREEQRARARRAQIVHWQEHLADRRLAVRSLTAITATEPRLLAAWLATEPLTPSFA